MILSPKDQLLDRFHTTSRKIVAWVIFCWLCALCPVMGLSMRVLAWDDNVAARKLALVAGTKVILVENMHPLKRTSVIKLNAENGILLRAMDAKPDASGKLPERSVSIAATMKAPLLLVLPDVAHATGLRILVIEDDTAGFAWGSYRFINATPKELVVQMEKTAKRVPPGWTPVDLMLGGETRGVGARISLVENIEEPLYSAVWEYNTESRTLCFIVPGNDARTSPVDFKAIPEEKISYELQHREAKKDAESE